MKTTHQLASDLLAGPDLPCFHFDPSRAGMDDERDTSLSEPIAELTDLSAEKYDRDLVEPDMQRVEKFIIIHGDGGEPHDEPGAFAELTIESLLKTGVITREQLNAAQEHARNTIAAG
jgi:hypothetical protein